MVGFKKDVDYSNCGDIDVFEIDVAEVVDRLGIDYEEVNGELWASCPNPDHDDSNPSWSININPDESEYGIYNCLGCHQAGNVVSLVKMIQGGTYLEAIQWIKSDKTLQRKIEPSTIAKTLRRRDTSNQSSGDVSLPEEFIPFTIDYLGTPDDIYVNYVHRRIQRDDFVIEHQIGFCDTGYYWGRIIIPVYNHKNQLLTFEARHVLSKREWDQYWPWKKYKKVLYPKHTYTKPILYPIDKLNRNRKVVIIVEGMMDYFALRNFGLNNVLSAFGNKFSEQKGALIANFDKVFVCPDADDGGNELVKNIRKYVDRRSLYQVVLPSGKDPAECTKSEIMNAFYHAKR